MKWCDGQGQQAVGTAIIMGFELTHYPEQIASFRRREHYDPATGEFFYNRNKTGAPARVAVSKILRARLKICGPYLIARKHKGVEGLDLATIADIGARTSTGAAQAVIERHYRAPDGKLASIGQAAREAYRNAE